MNPIPRRKSELIEAIKPYYAGRKSDLYEMTVKRLRKMYKDMSFVNLLEVMQKKPKDFA